MQRIKIPIKREDDLKLINVTRNNPYEHPNLSECRYNKPYGRPAHVPSNVDNVLKHDYLRNSLIQRIEKRNNEAGVITKQKQMLRAFL